MMIINNDKVMSLAGEYFTECTMKKILLPAALAILSGNIFAAMEVVEDHVLDSYTGQDGISLALNIKVHIDSFQWIDEAGAIYGNGNGNNGGGSGNGNGNGGGNGNGNNGNGNGNGGSNNTPGSGGILSFENIAIGGGALSTVAAGTYAGLNGNGSNDVISLSARTQYQTGVRFGGPINIDVEDVAAFSTAGSQLIGSLGGTDVAADGAAINAYGAQAAYTTGYSAHVPTGGTKAVAIGLPRMIMSFNVGAIRALGSSSGESYSMGGVRVTNFDFSSTKVAIWGHK